MPKKTAQPTSPPTHETRPTTVGELAEFLKTQKDQNMPVLISGDSEGNIYSSLAITIDHDKKKRMLHAGVEKMVPQRMQMWEPVESKKPPKTAQFCLILYPSA